jgi:hypothetical protein
MLNELRSDLGPAFGRPSTEEGRRTRGRVRQPVGEDDDDEEYAMAATYMSHMVDYHDGIAEPCSSSTEARPSALLPVDWSRGSHPNQTHWCVRGGTRKATGLGGVPDGYWPGGVWEGVVCFSPLAVGVQCVGALAWRFLVLFVLSFFLF